MLVWNLAKIKSEENINFSFLDVVSRGYQSISKANTYEFLLNHHCCGPRENQDRCQGSWKLTAHKYYKLKLANCNLMGQKWEVSFKFGL